MLVSISLPESSSSILIKRSKPSFEISHFPNAGRPFFTISTTLVVNFIGSKVYMFLCLRNKFPDLCCKLIWKSQSSLGCKATTNSIGLSDLPVIIVNLISYVPSSQNA